MRLYGGGFSRKTSTEKKEKAPISGACLNNTCLLVKMRG